MTPVRTPVKVSTSCGHNHTMPEGASRDHQKKLSNQAAKRPSSVSSLSGIVSRMASSGGASRGSCTSVNTVCSDSDRGASLSSSASSASLQDAHSSSSSSLPYSAVTADPSPQRNGSDISLDLTPLSLLPGVGAEPGAATPLPKLSRLERVELEIVETEQAYVRDLKSIVEDYLGCIIDCGDLPLKPTEVSILFCNIEDIYEFNSELLEDLERSPHAAAMAECFLERSENFEIYTTYCMNYPNSVAVLRDCMKNDSLVRFFQERQATLCHSLPLETYLLKPVQRIMKYHLLLQELSKHFDKSDPGYEVVEDAIITMTAVAWYINDMKEKQEHAVRLQEIESLLVNWTGPDLSGFGELVLEGSFRVQRVKKERAFFLFDKMLLIAKKRQDHFMYSTHIFCCNLLLVENMKDPLCFKVSDQTIPKQQHIVQAKNQEEKRLWLHYLKRLIVENHPASLPQKARQVLGDDFYPSPQFEHELIRKPAPSPRLDDASSYHRGRRQSEPPEFIYTPEKARKSFPMLVEGNLPYRRGRRQSAPANDIEAAFQQGVSLKAGSEGEVYPQVDGLGSSGSTSTLASSVIEVESGQETRGLAQEEDEDMVPLSPPPTLSITEEIMQFINQSRVREGMAELSTELCEPRLESLDAQPTEPQKVDGHDLPQVKEEDNQQEVIPNNLESQQKPFDVISDHEDDNNHSAHSFTTDSPSVKDFRKEDISLICPLSHMSKHIGGMTSLENNQSESHKPQVFIATTMPQETEAAEDTTAEDERSNPTNSIEEAIKDESAEPHSLCDHPPSCKPAENSQAPKVGVEQKLTKNDRQIIEKIRSYYEAAETVVDDGQATRRNSFSDIPTGLVKDSVSRFNIFVPQVSCDSESGRSDCNDSDIMSPPPIVPDQNRSSFTQPISPASAFSCNNQGQSQTESKCDVDLQACDFKPCMELWKEKERKASSFQRNLKDTGNKVDSFNEDKEPCAIHPSSINDKRTQGLQGKTMLEQNNKECTGINSPQEKQKAAKILQAVAGTRETIALNNSLDGLPSHIKVGRLSRHSKVGPCSKTLYEGMADVTGLGFFEDGPMSQCLVENSEKILSKVQMLARMYTAKASSMKVPLHQKQTFVAQRAWVAPNKVNPPIKSQQMLHQAQVKTQDQLSDFHMDSVISSSIESFGHVVVREQFTTTHHQENDCNLIGQKELTTQLGYSKTETSLFESTIACTEISSAIIEENLAIQMGTDEVSQGIDIVSTESYESSKEEQAISLPPCSQSQAQVMSEITDHCEQKSDHTLCSVREDNSAAFSTCVREDGIQTQLSPGDKLVMSCGSDYKVELFTDPVKTEFLKEEAYNAGEKYNSVLKPRDSKMSTVDTFGEMQLQASVYSEFPDYAATCTENCLSKESLSSIDVIETSLPMVSATYVGNSISDRTSNTESQLLLDIPISKVSEQTCLSQPQSQSSPTANFTKVPFPRDMHNPEPLKAKEESNNGLLVLSPPSTPPPCGPTTDNLPKFTSQRPSNLPTTMGRRSLSGNWNTLNLMSSQRIPQTRPWSRDQDQDYISSASAASSDSLSINDKSSGIPLGCSVDTRPLSAFSTRLRMRSPSPVRSSQQPTSPTNPSALAKSLAASCISQTISQSMAKRNACIQARSPTASSTPSSASVLRLRSPSPKPTNLHNSAQAEIGTVGLGSQIPKCPPSPFCSNTLCSSAAPIQSPPPYCCQQSLSPAPLGTYPSVSSVGHTRSDNIEQSPHTSLNGNNNNNNNNNNSLFSNGWASTKTLSSNMGGASHCHDPHQVTSHNRIARPFLSSEPNSRVQSPSTCPSPSLFTRIGSPPLLQSSVGPLITKPPNPRALRQGGSSPFIPLSLELSRSASICSLSPCASPRVTSPPPIGIPTNVWCIASPKPRNPILATPPFPTKAEVNSTSRSYGIASPFSGVSPSSASHTSQSQHKQRGSNLSYVSLARRQSSPSRNEHRSWTENGRWSVDLELGFN
ncbi:LOW QUALITY PROTEIN: uncharacterized protein plekhg2 [Electrophorus electricus]|uniref:LOW QUALITY PROTEIN: uncharacterized protein plekhg2 n=1 Tax=Electrophorus electricus TaxID=8005 RepID=UPI0015D00FB2|nr:LOW QUALITY PROTEIN: uncharacterized protein plekhg2 [Electrophorus electricus]